MVLLAVSLFAGSLLLYAPSLGHGFIGYDESAVLLGHPNLYNQASLTASLHEIVVGYFPREEPLIVRDLSWLIDARLFGFDRPGGYHLGNLLWNAVDVVLLFLFLLHATRSLAFAAVVAGLFSLLAVHVEPVCWVMGRKDLLGAFFTLLALLLQSLLVRSPSLRPSRRRLLASLVFLCVPLAILSKFSAIVLVVMLALHRLAAPYLDGTRPPEGSIGKPSEGFPAFPRSGCAGLSQASPSRLGLRARARELLWLWPHLVVTAGLYLWYQRTLAAFQVIGGRGPSPLSATHLTTVARLFPLSLGRSVEHLFSADQLSISYLRPNVALPLQAGELATIVVTAVVSALALGWSLTRRKDLAFFVLGFFVWMLPYANLEYIGIWVADRYAYLSSACVVALLVAVARMGWRGRRSWSRALGLMATAALAVTAVTNAQAARKHQAAFADARTFWDYELERAQPSLLAFESAAKTALTEAAAAEPASPRRIAAIARAVTVAEGGLRYYDALPWQPRSAYFSRERAHAAGLFNVLGLAARLSGRAPAEEVRYHRSAYQMMPSQHTALMLAQGLLDQARGAPPSEAVARESLHFFALYLREVKSDPMRRPGLAGLLGQYRRDFPGLDADVEQVASENLR